MDKLLKISNEDTWEAWGDDYTTYARELVEDLSFSEDEDNLRRAIEELGVIGNMLGYDFYDERRTLEEIRNNIRQREDYDENRNRIPVNRPADDSVELDRVFSSLLT